MVRKHTTRAAGAAIATAVVLATGTTLLLLAQWVESRYFPVLSDWSAGTVVVTPQGVLVSGKQRKPRDCEYIGPIRAVNEAGVHLSVKSYAATTGQNWMPSRDLRAYGPWLIYGAAGHRVTLYAEHRCHPAWPTFSTLGVVDTSGASAP